MPSVDHVMSPSPLSEHSFYLLIIKAYHITTEIPDAANVASTSLFVKSVA